MKQRVYDGTAFIGTAGNDTEYAVARDSIDALRTRPGDALHFGRGTKGYEVRQLHLTKFLASSHNWLFLIDTDQTFPPGALERLRSHGLPYVSGLYMRRSYAPVAPVWFKPFKQWPFEPWDGPIEKNALHKIGASGWGCMLVHREVVESVRKLLHGEWEILEDDMDVWPYDLAAIMAALRGLRTLADTRPAASTLYPALEAHTKTLEAQIRPLRGRKDDNVGSDIRFPFFALKAGYQLYGDSGVRCGHIVNYAVSADDYDAEIDGTPDAVKAHTAPMLQAERKRQAAARAALR